MRCALLVLAWAEPVWRAGPARRMLRAAARRSLLEAIDEASGRRLLGWGPAPGAAAPRGCLEAPGADGSCPADLVLDGVPGISESTHLKIWVMPSDRYISGTILTTHRTWEWSEVQRMIDKLSSTPGVFLDVGANLGSYSVPIAGWQRAQQRPGGVISVDARKECAALVTRTASANLLPVTPVHAALVDDAARYPHGVCTSADGAQTQPDNRTACRELAPALTLDQLLERDPAMTKVAAAKLDCEGCEGRALYGGSKWLDAHPPCHLMFELTEKYLCEAGTPWADLKAYLVSKGYQLETPLRKEIGACQKDMEAPQFNVWWAQADMQRCRERLDRAGRRSAEHLRKLET